MLGQKVTIQKNHAQFPSLKNFQKALNGNMKSLVLLYSQNYVAGILKSSHPPKFSTPKSPESKISNPKKSFDHPRLSKSGVSPLGT